MKNKLFKLTIFFTSMFFVSCKSEKFLIRTIGHHYHKKWFFKGESGQENTTIPFEWINGWIVIKVKLNNQEKEYNLVFDTGAITSIKRDIMNELQLFQLKDFTTTDVNGVKNPSSLINIENIQIGSRTFNKVGALSSNNSLFKCYGLDGVFGYNLLEFGVYKFNFIKNELTISNGKLNFDKNAFHTINLATDWRKMMYFNLKTRNRNIKAVLDSGASNYIFLNNSLQSEFDTTKLLLRKLQYISASNSTVHDTLSIYKNDILKVGNIELNKDLIVFFNVHNTVGNEFLNNYEEVVIDAKKMKLYLSKKETQKSNVYKIANINIGFFDQFVRVNGLSLNYKIESNPLKIGDQIISINGKSTKEIKDNCAFDTFESTIDFTSPKINLIILREGKEYFYEIDNYVQHE